MLLSFDPGAISVPSILCTILHTSVCNQMDKRDRMCSVSPHTGCQHGEWCEAPGPLISCCNCVFRSHEQRWKLFANSLLLILACKHTPIFFIRATLIYSFRADKEQGSRESVQRRKPQSLRKPPLVISNRCWDSSYSWWNSWKLFRRRGDSWPPRHAPGAAAGLGDVQEFIKESVTPWNNPREWTHRPQTHHRHVALHSVWAKDRKVEGGGGGATMIYGIVLWSVDGNKKGNKLLKKHMFICMLMCWVCIISIMTTVCTCNEIWSQHCISLSCFFTFTPVIHRLVPTILQDFPF